MSEVVVSVDNVGKKFCRSLQKGMMYTSADVMRDMAGVRGKSSALRQGEFWAVKDVSFELRRGDSLGLIGHNGAGKSTLLKMLNGIIRPDTGSIRMKGRIGALIEVGAGFHPMLSGRENIYVNGAILGMSKREIDRKFDQIVDFSGLPTDVLDSPVKSYSSGMYVRLGFSVAAHCEPDILLIDEVLAVGDGAFRVRCAHWIADYLKRDGTLILVSHSLPQIRECCNRALVFKHGQPAYLGSTLEGLVCYQVMTADESEARYSRGRADETLLSPIRITGCQVMADGTPADQVDHGQDVQVQVRLNAQSVVSAAHMHLVFTSEDTGYTCGWTSRLACPDGLTFQPGGHHVNVNIDSLGLVPGNYSISAYLSDANHLGDYGEFHSAWFIVRTHPVVDSRFGTSMMKGSVHVS